jgi:hypothetical protein
MVSRDYSIPRALLESFTALRRRATLTAHALLIAIVAALILTSNPVTAATITVNSLADPGAPGICALRDAIAAANTHTRVNGCNAGSGNDTIHFSVTGIIQLAFSDPLPGVTDSQLTVNGPITIDANVAFGGWVIASSATVKLKYLTIQNAGCCGGSGDAISNAGTLTLTNSTIIRGRYAVFNGGTLTITDSTFRGNFGDVGFGPSAIGNYGTLTVTNGTVTGNIDWAVENHAQATITDSSFSGNRQNGGPALLNDQGGSLVVINSTFADNTSVFGAAAIVNDGSLSAINSTFSGNATLGELGPVVGAIENNGSLTLRNSIVANSTDTLSGNPIANCDGTITDAGYNISDDDSCSFSATGSRNNTNPGLSSDGLTNNGGPTETIALAGDSPAVDAIPLADCRDQNGKSLKTDQRGLPRPDAGESVCDIGAFETQDGCSQNRQGNNNCQ